MDVQDRVALQQGLEGVQADLQVWDLQAGALQGRRANLDRPQGGQWGHAQQPCRRHPIHPLDVHLQPVPWLRNVIFEY